jgi:hypothetical protein
MPVSTAEARAQILEGIAAATDWLALASTCLTEAHEQLDDATADRLEAEVFMTLQKAFGRSKRTATGFAGRVGVGSPPPTAQSSPTTARGAKELIEHAAAAAAEADRRLAELQDSMLPIEAGDAELRAGIAEVRELAERVPGPARELVRGLGR